MRNKSYYNPAGLLPAIRRLTLLLIFDSVAYLLLCSPPAFAASDAPPWMHALVSASLPAYDEKTDAVLLYSETNVVVVSADKVRTQVRKAYKILRPEGRYHGTVVVYVRSNTKLTGLHGWCIPAQGKDFEVKDKDATEMAPFGMENGELVTDLKARVLHIPAPEPGNIVGYEYEVEEQPFVLQDGWHFQETSPVRESHYSLVLPPGWEYKASWLNYPEAKPSQIGTNRWEWSVRDVKEIRIEAEMPPVSGIAGQMMVAFFPAGGQASKNGFANWKDMGNWYQNLSSGRVDASPEIKQEASTLTASRNTLLEKMQSMAEFVQHDIRYVAIELGIGGWQPHFAADIFAHRYGDCKDKATLMRSLLHEIGVDSYYVHINTERGSITPATPANLAFNHVIVAIKLPEGLVDPLLIATWQEPALGRLLFFDPTDDLTPFGRIRGPLQANYGLLVTPNGGELVELPQQAAAMNSIRRTAKFTLDANGTLKGDVKEMRLGDRAVAERWRLRTVTKDTDRIKPIESLLAGSLSSFQISRATILNLQLTDQPFGFDYSFVSDNYAKNAGDLLLVRPRVLGDKSSGLLETKEPRKFAIELDEPTKDTDTFEITIPPGYSVDDVPPPVDADFSFASYHSKTETTGNQILYTRTFEVKELTVPVERSDELKKFYRTIATDERSTVVLKAATK